MLSNIPASDSPKHKRKKLTRRDIFKKVFSCFAAIAFLSMMGSGLIKMYSNALQSGQETPEEEVPSATEQASILAARERGYELVLEREPNNSTALEGLVQTRIEMNHLSEAIPPLEALVSINPDRGDLKALLDQLKEDVGTE